MPGCWSNLKKGTDTDWRDTHMRQLCREKGWRDEIRTAIQGTVSRISLVMGIQRDNHGF